MQGDSGARGDPLTHQGLARTDVHCHECQKVFIAELDHSITGNHIAECPHCGHHHFRVIKDGKITEDRWNSAYGAANQANRARRVWKATGDVLVTGATNTASSFLRERWLERLQ